MKIIEAHYFPCIAYFAALIEEDRIWIEGHENYVKQSYRNRMVIRSANKIENLSVPVQAGNSKTAIRDLKIDYNQSWVKNHWRALQSSYGKSPYFEYYEDYIRDVFKKEHKYLFDLNVESLTLCLKFLQMDSELRITNTYEKAYNPSNNDLRGVISPKKEISAYDFFSPEPYPQIFGKDFVANLSVLDLLFCEGPNARTIIKKSVFS